MKKPPPTQTKRPDNGTIPITTYKVEKKDPLQELLNKTFKLKPKEEIPSLMSIDNYKAIQKAGRSHEEDDLQMECVRWFNDNYPNLLLIHVPNQRKSRGFTNKKGKFIPTEAVRLKKMGVISGVADLMLFEPVSMKIEDGRHAFKCGLAIEMKAKTKQSAQQKDFENKIVKKGWVYTIAKSLEEFKSAIAIYLIGEWS